MTGIPGRGVGGALAILSAVLQYVGVSVIGVTPSQKPWEPKRPLEILHFLAAYNEACAELGTPPVRASSFTAYL